jgi:small basic protein
VWWLPVLGLLIGVAIGIVFSLTIPAQYSRYTAMALLAALDSVLGAVRAELDGEFDNLIFLTGFFVNILLAGTLTYLGDRLGVELYIAARTPLASSESTWSFISEIRGETTIASPGRCSAGSW